MIFFAVLVARGSSGVDAYLGAGYKVRDAKVARVAAARLLSNVTNGIQERIDELRRDWAEKAGVTVTDVIREMSAPAFYDPRKLVKWKQTKKGVTITLVSSDKLDDKTASAIKSVKMGLYGPEFTFHDKIQALKLIGQHLGAFSGESADRANVNIDQSQNITYIDAPRRESLKEWTARIERERGVKQTVEVK